MLIINISLILDSINNKDLLILEKNYKICNKYNRSSIATMRKILIKSKSILIFLINNIIILFLNINLLLLKLIETTLNLNIINLITTNLIKIVYNFSKKLIVTKQFLILNCTIFLLF